jgi:RNA polymerase sigma-70 factor, ECF subfamily
MAGMTATNSGSELAVPGPLAPDSADGFTRLYDEYAAGLHRYLARRVGEQVAYDLVSETFLVAFRQRGGYDPERAGVRAWLYGIATNLVRRHVRQEVRALRAVERVARREPPAVAGHDGQVAERLDARRLAERLAPALAELPDADRDVLLLTAWGGLSAAEVADALGIPVGTVRSRLHRVRRRLRARAAFPVTTTSPEDEDDD